MFTGAVAFFLLFIVTALCGYGASPSPAAAQFAQHALLVSFGCFAVCALAVIAELDENLFARHARALVRRKRQH
jgi:hypothetical protein